MLYEGKDLLETNVCYRWIRLAKAAGYRLDEMVRLADVSPRQLQRKFRDDLDRSPEEWLSEQRMVSAPYLLRSNPSIKQVAIELGYMDAAHFCHHFKNAHGLTASEFLDRFVASPTER